jgi:hypothetical protein
MKKETKEKEIELSEFVKKILAGLVLTRERLVEFKKQKNTPLVIMQDDKIVFIPPSEL